MGDSLLIFIYLVFFLILVKLSPFIISAVIIGFYFSIIIEVPAGFLSKKMNKAFSKVLSYIVILGLVTYAFVNFVPIVIAQGRIIFDTLSGLKINSNTVLPSWVLDFLNDLNRQVSGFALEVLNKVISYAPSFITMAVLIVVTTVAVGNLKGYIGINAEKLFLENPKKGKSFLKKFYKEFEKFVQGQVVVAAIVGILVGASCVILGIKGAFFLGVLSFITDFIPFLGVIITAVPMLMLGFSTKGLFGLILAAIILIGVNQVEAWILAPKIQSANLKIHWFVLIIVLLIFNDIFGLAGILIAIPTLLFVREYWNTYMFNK
ncbi:AI-2E family transporter [Thermosipho ferrireducens]|uniref:AI-2E family transporter n=1 Tax=Thermosipho ferrireducens TaxID=2571116 RepID=A0ABX7S9H6_9BACT|nr:AI-2E family transporter [Thermosipho ferrireducens]